MADHPEQQAEQQAPAEQAPAAPPAAEQAPAEQAAPAAPQGEQQPPWGDDFDPARAWATIQRLRQEVKDAKAAQPAEQPAAEQQPAPDVAERLARAEKAAQDAQRALWVERALRKHDVPDDLVDLVSGESEEAVNAIAERLAGRVKPDAEQPAEQMPERPQPSLTPGHGGEPRQEFDPDAIAAAALAARHS